MALKIEDLRRAPQGAQWVSPERICVSADDEVVACDDTRAVRLLVGAGGSIPVSEAEQYGLVAHDEPLVADASAEQPPPDAGAPASQEPQPEVDPEEKAAAPDEDKGRKGLRNKGR